MLSIFKTPKVVDTNTAEQLQITFEWLAANFDNSFFHSKTVLVKPSRDYFPDRASSPLEMAASLCRRIQNYTGLEHWPFKVVEPQYFLASQPAILAITTSKRGHEELAETPCTTLVDEPEQAILEISYSPEMMKKPMDLVGSVSKNIAQHYLYQSQLPLPAGPESFDATSEILAVFMGFGIFIANSAYTFRGSCARCYDPRANRAAALSEDEAIYCLALFAYYKKIETKAVTGSLKSYLRSRYKSARKQVERDLNHID